MTLCDIAEDKEQWRELVALASMVESRWMMKTWQREMAVYIIQALTRRLENGSSQVEQQTVSVFF